MSFHAKLYSAAALTEAADAFAHLAKVRLEKRKGRHKVVLTPLDNETPETLADEFANYALSRTIAARS